MQEVIFPDGMILNCLIKKTVEKHDRIIFNGNCYDEAWVKEAEARGLSNLESTPDALPHLLDTLLYD